MNMKVEIPLVGADRDRLIAQMMSIQVDGDCDGENVPSGGDYGDHARCVKCGYDDHVSMFEGGHEVQIREYSTSDIVFLSECIPWLQTKLEWFSVRFGREVRIFCRWDMPGDDEYIKAMGRQLVEIGPTLADAGTRFMLRAKEADLLG